MTMTATDVDHGHGVDGHAAEGHHHAAGLDVAACLFHGLSDPGRLRILQHLMLGEHRVVDLTAHLGLAQSTVSVHVACLRDCGLLDVRHEGRSSHYRLAHPAATATLLRAAEELLRLTGDAVTICPTHGHSAHDEEGGR